MAPNDSGARERLLFVTPAKPMKGGYGMTMRAGSHVEALSQRYDVSILLVNQDMLPAHHKDVEIDTPEWEMRSAALVSSRVERLWARLTRPGRNTYLRLLFNALRPALSGVPDRPALSAALRQLADGKRFDVIFAYKLHAAPTAWALRGHLRAPDGLLVVDTDDVESDAVRSFADASRRGIGRATYWLQRLTAMKLRAAETKWFRRFDRVFVCSEKDRLALSRRYPTYGEKRFRVVPNVFRLPAAPLPWSTGDEINLLFVGTMAYAPNVDAVSFFCDEILPIMRREWTVPFRVWIVGRNPTRSIKSLEERNPEITVTGTVPDVATFYARANVVIVPLRMGGGTRIKILEAVGYGRPVVSTSIGAEGLEFVPDREIMIADDARQFAAQCLSLAREPDRARAIAVSALERCRALYSLDGLKARLNCPIAEW